MGLILGALAAIATTVGTITKALAVVGLAVQGLKAVGSAIASIAKSLGIIKPERDVEELGDRALQAEEKGITPEKCGSYEAWAKSIDADDWGYDPEKNKDMDPEKKIMKGIEVASSVAVEKFPNLPMDKFFALSGKNPEFFTPERMGEIAKLANTDKDSFGKIVNYVVGTNDRTVINDASDLLMNVEKTLNPGLSDGAAYDKVAPYFKLSQDNK